MKISELFRRDIHRTIEEVVKVDLADEDVIAAELDEYIATTHILHEMEEVLEAYQESINSPNETCTVWVSGFFGSGKSSWAKVLGYLLWNPTVVGQTAAERFFERTHAPRLAALLNTIRSQAPTLAVMLNLATGANVVAKEGESVIWPAYRALLEQLGYSRNFILAELEYTLEGDGKLEEFETAFLEIVGHPWKERRFTALATRDAVRALDAVYGESGDLPDWARELVAPDINADWFATRALELLDRRGGGAKRLALIVDEAGQYVARSVQRMLDLQGLAEAFQKRRGKLWLVVTSQEKLDDVVDSLESRQVELARAQARFPLRVDLLPSDIDEVTGKRILDKTGDGQRLVREVMAPHRNQLIANVRLASPTRIDEPSEDELIRLYPLLPYQIQLLIDAVSVRRTQGGASPTIGGSNRTLIKHAQQLIIHPEHGLGECEIGTLVTLDRSFMLLEELIPTSWRAEIEQVVDKYGRGSVEAKIMKVVALCVEVPALPLTTGNIAALLHPSVAAEGHGDEFGSALVRLVNDDRLRETEEGYKLQSPEQKDWEQTRRGIDLNQGSSVRLRRQLIKQALTGLTVSKGRTFKADVTVEGENVVSGDLSLMIEEADSSQRESLRSESRESANENVVTWVYELQPDTWDALLELHRSRTMIERRDNPNRSASEIELLGEERMRAQRHEAIVLQRLARDLAAGQVVFRGRIDDIDGSDLRSTSQRLLTERLDEIYPQLEQFTASLRKEDVMHVLRTSDLSALPQSLGDDGIGLITISPEGYQFVTEPGPLAVVMKEVRNRESYGQEATGNHLESTFARPPYGAQVEVIQALCAAALRAGLIEVIHQGQRIANAADLRLDQVFGALPRFRAAAFRSPSQSDVPLEARVDLAEKLEHIGQTVPGQSTDALAGVVRKEFAPTREMSVRVISILKGLGIAVPETVTRTQEIIGRLSTDDDVEVVVTAHGTWADLIAGRQDVDQLDSFLADNFDDLSAAQQEAARPSFGIPSHMKDEHAELSELLASGDLVSQAGRIVALGSRLGEAREAITLDAGQRLTATLEDLKARLRREYHEAGEAVLAEAIRPLDALEPPENLSSVDAASLESRIDSAHAKSREAQRKLEELLVVGDLAWVQVSEAAPELIVSEEDIDPALDRIREAIATELAAGKQVRLQ